MLRFITTADTEILAAAAAVERLGDDFPAVRCANPGGAIDQAAFVDEILDGARVVLVRILGGRRGWPVGFDLLRARCQADGIALLALGGELEPDAEMTSLSLAPTGAVAQAGEYLRHGDIANVEQLLRFLADTFLLEGYGFEPPHEVPDLGVYVPGVGDVPVDEAFARHDPDAADGRHLLLPLAPHHRQRRLGRRAGRADRGRRRERDRRVVDDAAPRRRRQRARARAARGPHRRAADDDARHRRLARRRHRAALGRGGDRGARRAGAAGRLLDLDAGGVAGVGQRPDAAGCRHAGRDPRVRRAPARRRRLLQGARRGRLERRRGDPALRRRPRALRARRAAGRAPRPAALHPERRQADRPAADELSDEARAGRDGGRARHAGLGARPARRAGRGGLRGRAAVRARRRAHARADRRRRPRPRVRHRRAARQRHAALPDRRVRGVVRDAAGVAARGDGGALGPAAGRPVRRRRRLRGGGAGAGERARSRSSRRAATARTRSASTTTPSCRPRTTTSPATASCRRRGGRTRSSTSASTARWSGCPARCSRCRPSARPTPRSATCRSSTRSSSTTPARACRPSAAPTR